MRVTLWLDSGRPWSAMRALATQAEQAGWDGIRLGDAPGARECWAVLGALAEAVPRVRLEAVVRQERGRHPAVVAKLASTVDQLSGGRLLLGWAADDTDEARLAEALEVVKILAGQERASFRGRFYRLQDAPLDPKPVQPPFPLLLVGGDPGLAVRYADHWSIAGSPDDISRQTSALTEACRRVGRDRSQISVSACSARDATAVDEGLLREWAEAGVEDWVVPDTSLGDDQAGWPASLAQIRADTASVAAI